MKKLYLYFLFFLLLSTSLIAQNTLKKADDLGRIAICPYVNLNPESVTVEAQDFLREKISQIVVPRSLGGTYGQTRFLLAASVQFISKAVVPGTPTRYSYELQVTFYLGDGVEGRLFSSAILSLSGLGTSQTKALKSALKNINPASKVFDTLISNGKQKIIEYYNSICDAQFKDAERIAAEGDIMSALIKLSEIPDAARECYAKSRDLSTKLYREHKERECASLLNKAKNTWSANPSPEGGLQAAEILNALDPSTSCFRSAKTLIDKINSEIKSSNVEIEKFNRTYLLNEQRNQNELENQRINAVKDMVVSYYNSQPSTVIYYRNYNVSPWYYY